MSVAVSPDEVAEQVKVLIENADPGTFSLAFTLERNYLPERDLEEMGDTLFVDVVAADMETSPYDRGETDTDEFVAHVAIRKKLDKVDNATIDPLLQFSVKEMAKFLRRRSLATNPPASYMQLEVVPYSMEHLQKQSTYFSLLKAHYHIRG